jgi:RsiW-degrading membrane proteinase PrsW (M82 family)
MKLIFLALSPVFIILIYVYFRDKYEKEPLGLLIKSLVAGGLIVLPVVFIENILNGFVPAGSHVVQAGYTAFVVAGMTEEFFKFSALYLLIWKNPNFNEKFDGIVYAVFVSLGFAGVENVMYVLQGGGSVALVRALTAVPAHALFGITMGYFFGIAHMMREKRVIFLRRAFFVPFILHGIYDFIILSQIPVLLTLFVPFMIALYISGFRRMKIISDASDFRKNN